MAENGTLPSTDTMTNKGITGTSPKDVLVQWSDHTKNVVKSSELHFRGLLHQHQRVKMRWGRTWWRGKVLAYESASQEASDESETFRDVDVTSEQDSSDSQVIGELSDSDLDEMDDIPLTQLQTHLASTQKPLHETDGNGKVNVTDSEEMDDMSLMQLQTHLARTNKSMTSSEAAVCPPSQTAPDLNANKTTTPTELAATAIPNATTPTKEAGEHQESQMMNISEQCSEFHCLQDIFAACAQCQCLLCFEHFIRSDACSNHNKYFSVYVDNMSSSVIDNSPCFVEVGATDNTLIQDEMLTTVDVGMNIDCVSDPSQQKQPEDYVVDGEERVETGFSANVQPSGTKARNKNVTFKRNQGESYYTEKTNRYVLPRKEQNKQRCSSAFCDVRKLSCKTLTESDRKSIQHAFYDLGNLSLQRQWISRHLEIQNQSQNPRKKIKLKYFLPLNEELQICSKVQVCKVMFLNTLGLSERQVSTVVKKTRPLGVIEPEKRGGRVRKDLDQQLADEVHKHINRFPKMESHFCRANTGYQYLSPDLNINRMHRLYLEEHKKNGRKASLSFYSKIFKSMKLKFHSPKKDLCGLCDAYRKGNEEEKMRMCIDYEKHIQEKCKVRELKEEMKEKAHLNPETFVASVFDLEQVLYLPRSNRGELFYQRRLSCYNFTVYELASKTGYCYLHHEGLAKRGSNEIASNLYSYLTVVDREKKNEAAFFCDGCRGQNKNSVLPAMLMHFVKHSKSMKSVTISYFETNHGQSEGDAMHSTVERAMKNFGDIFLPAQLAALIKLARRNPSQYIVNEIQTTDIHDWKQLSRDMHILKVRKTVEGEPVDWTKVMAVKVEKNSPSKIQVKFSHTDVNFSTIAIGEGQRKVGHQLEISPKKAYPKGPPKLSQDKYADLMKMCTGTTPLIYHADHVSFYKHLPHQ